jgi:hypothetical protein
MAIGYALVICLRCRSNDINRPEFMEVLEQFEDLVRYAASECVPEAVVIEE